jgi:hypothetical protein
VLDTPTNLKYPPATSSFSKSARGHFVGNVSRLGLGVDAAQFGRVNIALNRTCSIDGKMEAAGTLTLGFKF